MSTTYAAHIVTAEAGLGDPEVLIMTPDEGFGATLVDKVNIPAEYANDLNEIKIGMRMFGWHQVGEPSPTDYGGYWVVDVEKA